MANIDINNFDYEYFTPAEIADMYDSVDKYKDLVEIYQENWG